MVDDVAGYRADAGVNAYASKQKRDKARIPVARS